MIPSSVTNVYKLYVWAKLRKQMLLKIPDTQTAKPSQILGFEVYLFIIPPSFRPMAGEIIRLVIIVLLYQ